MPDWMMFAAGTSTDLSTRDLMVSQIQLYASSNQGQSPFPVIYNSESGNPIATNAGVSSPAIGGVFSLLALKYVCPHLP